MSTKILNEVRNWNATNLFVVPLLKINRVELIKVGFVNAFLKDELRDLQFERGVYLLFRRTTGLERFLQEERERGAPLLDEYDYKDYVIVVYQYEEKWEEDIKIIMTGKFSKTSLEYKNSIPKTYTLTTIKGKVEQLTVQHSIFKKDPEIINYWEEVYGLNIDYRTDEVWLFYEENEILNEKKL